VVELVLLRARRRTRDTLLRMGVTEAELRRCTIASQRLRTRCQRRREQARELEPPPGQVSAPGPAHGFWVTRSIAPGLEPANPTETDGPARRTREQHGVTP